MSLSVRKKLPEIPQTASASVVTHWSKVMALDAAKTLIELGFDSDRAVKLPDTQGEVIVTSTTTGKAHTEGKVV